MKVLFIGGTGNISASITKALVQRGDEVWLINRGNHSKEVPENVKTILADVNDEADVAQKIAGMHFDVVCDFIGFEPAHVQRDYRLFAGKTEQYMFISSASTYHKPMADYRITEGVTLANPYWAYSKKKIACEEFLMQKYREEGFPVTVIRPSHTYSERKVPVGVHGSRGSWQVLKRMLEGKPVIIHGDGTSLWTITTSEDFAKAFLGLMGNPHAIGEAFQITSDEALTWNQIHELIAKNLGVKLNAYHVASDFLAAMGKYDLTGALLGDKAWSVVFDNTKLKQAVPGFQATIRAEEGIRRSVQYALTHPECQVEDPEFDAWCDRIVEKMERIKQELQAE